MSRRVVVDCDTGVDDALALLYLAAEPGTEIIAAGSVHGNVGAELAAVNTLRVLEVAGLPHVPVAVGAARPLAQPLVTAEDVHGHDGLGGVGHPEPRARPVPGSAAEQLVWLAREQPRGFDLLATGPLTNLALALLLEPNLPKLIPRVVVMGGATAAPGNVTAVAEANIWHDPEAAALVLGAPWQLTLVPLDITDTVLLGPAELDRLERDGGPVARFCWKILQHYLDFHLTTVGSRVCALHDPLAAMLLTHPDLAEYEQATVTVECGGASRGATIVDRRAGASRGGNAAVARQVRRQEAVDRLMTALTTPAG